MLLILRSFIFNIHCSFLRDNFLTEMDPKSIQNPQLLYVGTVQIDQIKEEAYMNTPSLCSLITTPAISINQFS